MCDNSCYFKYFCQRVFIQQHSNKIRSSENVNRRTTCQKIYSLKNEFQTISWSRKSHGIKYHESTLWKKRERERKRYGIMSEKIFLLCLSVGRKSQLKEDNDLFFPMGWLMQPLNWMDYSFKEFVVKLSVNKEKRNLTIQFITM